MSNLPKTRNLFVWKAIEFIMGVAVVIPVCILIQLSRTVTL